MARADAPLAGLASATSTPTPPVPLDDVDLALLQALSTDSRTSQRGLARELGMSAPAIGERITRLERSGVIQRYGVVVDWEAAGFPVVTYLAITAMQGYDLQPVMAAVSALPEVETITVVTGELDLLARLRVRDVQHLRSVLLEKVWQISGVQRTETYLSIAEGAPKNFVFELVQSLRTGTTTTAAPPPSHPPSHQGAT
jgi:Lrp/AsnC family transcriptional regulator for asnA, asnC and gidA